MHVERYTGPENITHMIHWPAWHVFKAGPTLGRKIEVTLQKEQLQNGNFKLVITARKAKSIFENKSEFEKRPVLKAIFKIGPNGEKLTESYHFGSGNLEGELSKYSANMVKQELATVFKKERDRPHYHSQVLTRRYDKPKSKDDAFAKGAARVEMVAIARDFLSN